MKKTYLVSIISRKVRINKGAKALTLARTRAYIEAFARLGDAMERALLFNAQRQLPWELCHWLDLADREEPISGRIAQRLTEILDRRMTEGAPYGWYYGDAPRFNPEGTYVPQYEEECGGHFFYLWVHKGAIPYVC